ncbi:alpha/beta fold hydrolase [Glaciecola sp. MF2-115]|uniref:alpha/beta fold hydrolase n=1 Tax=Glaciecola sp. MF2-115 TaxID=3384827 RepID=UPI0039A0978C
MELFELRASFIITSNIIRLKNPALESKTQVTSEISATYAKRAAYGKRAARIGIMITLVLLWHSNTYAETSARADNIELADSLEQKDSREQKEPKKASLAILPRVETKPCVFLQQYPKYDAKCGTLFVKENPNSSNTVQNPARVASIPIMIFQPEGEVSGEPVVITGGGGPGSAIYIMNDFDGDPSMFYSGIEETTLKAGRPLILMEMRGSGLSVANLDCPAITQLEIDMLSTYPYKWDNKKYLHTVTNCANRKKLSGIDANFYNTDYAVQDIDKLRELLGFEKWHLLGISHGTRIALRYAQLYPQRASSLILDSLYPFEVDSYQDIAQYNASVINQPFVLCDADPKCKLENGQASITLFEALMAQLRLDPPTLDVEYYDENWTIGQKKIKVSPELVAYTLLNNSYETEAIVTFPQIIKDALNKDYAKLSKLISETIDLLNYTWFSEGAYSSYACYEEIPFSNYALAIENAKKYKTPYWDDVDTINLDRELCKIWNIKPAVNDIKSFDYNQLNLPILILAGDLDPFTPAIWSVNFHSKLPMRNKTQHLRIWPLKSHNLVYDDKCVEAVMTSFLNAPENTIDNECAIKDVSELEVEHSIESESLGDTSDEKPSTQLE